MEIQDILTLIQAVDEHKLTELKLDDGDVKLSLKKEEASQIVNVTGGGFQSTPGWTAAGDVMAVPAGMVSSAGIVGGPGTAGMIGMAGAAGMTGMTGVSGLAGVTGLAGVAGTPAGGISGEELNGAAGIDSDKVVNSPLVGTFYNAASPDAEPFVKVGDTVKKGQVMGIIEAMKLMNEIECEFDGVVEAVLVGNEDVVEYGQPLFRIR